MSCQLVSFEPTSSASHRSSHLSENRKRVRSIRRLRLIDIPMLHHTRPIQPKRIRHRHLPTRHIQMHKPNAPVKRLVHNRPIHAWDEIHEKGNGGCTPLRRVRRVVDVVQRDVGQVGSCRVLEGVELVDEVEEDGVLLAGGGGLRGQNGA